MKKLMEMKEGDEVEVEPMKKHLMPKFKDDHWLGTRLVTKYSTTYI